MDAGTAGNATANEHDKQSGPSSDSNRNESSPASRHSPVIPLAPLEYLQNQRRGSITDPSLHTSSNPQSRTLHSGTSHDHHPKHLVPRPTSPYVFGGVPAQSSNPAVGNGIASSSRKGSAQDGSTKTRSSKILSIRLSTSHDSLYFSEVKRTKVSDKMDIDSEPSSKPPTPASHGTKRKVSSDRTASIAQHIDPQLVGPGLSSAHEDTEGPAPKRRGSTVDAHKIGQLSLYDRRNSADVRGVAGPSGAPFLHFRWWTYDQLKQ